MKKYFCIILCLFTLFLTSCNSGSYDPDENYEDYDYSEEYTDGDASEIPTSPDMTEEDPGPVPMEEIDPGIEMTTSSAEYDYDYHQLYYDYINSDSSHFYDNGVRTDSEPVYTFIDLESDSIDEAIVLFHFYNANHHSQSYGTMYVLDIIDNQVRCVYSSDSLGLSRMTDHFRIYENNSGEIRFSKYWNDGNAVRKGTEYEYDGLDFIPVISYDGCKVRPTYYYVGYGMDSFESSDGFTEITEEEYLPLEDRITESGNTLWSPNDFLKSF